MIDFHSLSLSGDEDQYCLSFSCALATIEDWLEYPPGRKIRFTINGRAYDFLVESRSRERAHGRTTYAISGRSPTVALDASVLALSRTWGEIGARAAAQELCDLAGVALDWRVLDWTIPAGTLSAESETPVTVLGRIAAACGGVLQSSPGGGLIVRYRYPVSPSEYPGLADVARLSDLDDIFTASQSLVQREGYDAVRVGSRSVEDMERIVLEADADLNASTTPAPGTAYYLRVSALVPYRLRASSGTLALVGAGTGLAVADETVAFYDEAEADVAKRLASLDVVSWFGAGGGAVEASGFSGVVLEEAALAVAQVDYTTRYDLWKFTPDDLGEAFAVAILAETVDDATTPEGVWEIVRGEGGRPAPEDLVNPLAATEACAAQLGRNYLDAHGADVIEYDLDACPEGQPLPGEVVEVADAELGEDFRGLVTAFELAVAVDDDGAASLTWRGTVERPA